MNDIEALFASAEKDISENWENNEALAAIYLRVCDYVARIEKIKDEALAHLYNNLVKRNETWGECRFATYGLTEPKAKAKVDEEKWRDAVAASLELNSLELEYMKARMPFMTDATQEVRPYIRRKRNRYE